MKSPAGTDGRAPDWHFLLDQYALGTTKVTFPKNCTNILPTKWAVNSSERESGFY